jgi:hypothetical protein
MTNTVHRTMNTARRTGVLALAGAAGAISGIGFLTAPTPAQAAPCSQYGFVGDFPIQQANHWQVFVTSTGPTNVGGKAVEVNSDTSEKITGDVSGGIINGGNIDLTIHWAGHPAQRYTGRVDDDALVHSGLSRDLTNGDYVTWVSTRPLACSTPAAPAPQPVIELPKTDSVPATGPKYPLPPPASGPDATVRSDVDVYDAPGGNGTVIGILRSGRQVKFAGEGGLPAGPGQTCKPSDWCHVVVPELPGGSGWVWDDFLIF